MIFRIRLPKLEDLFGFEDDNDVRDDITKETKVPHDPSGGGFVYHVCTCICHDVNYRDGTFYGMFMNY